MASARYRFDENPLTVQSRVIWALILRETRVTFGNAQLGYLWAIANPILTTTIMVLIFSFISRMPPIGTSFILFFATGIIPFEMYNKLANSLMAVFTQNKGLMTYPLVKETDAVFARYLLVIATYFLVLLVFFSTLIMIGFAPWPHNPGSAIAAIFCLSLFGLGVGVTNAVVKCLWGTWPQIYGIISRPLFFISGIFFIPTTFPPYITDWLAWNPLLHFIDWFRAAYYINYESVIFDGPFLFYVTTGLLLTGFGGARLFRKKLA